MHLSAVVNHDEGCTCSHCKQSSADRRIEAMIGEAGLHVLNGSTPTHDSGTIIDLILGEKPGRALTHRDKIGGSDHRMVSHLSSSQITVEHRAAVGRVDWTSSEEWMEGLIFIGPVLSYLTLAVSAAANEIAAHPGIPARRRRAVLEAAAWTREALYCLVGHANGQVIARPPKRARQHCNNNTPSDKDAVEETIRRKKCENFSRFLQLQRSDPAKAQKFLSSFFQRQKKFDIALVDSTTGRIVDERRAVEMVAADIDKRGNNDLPYDQASANYLKSVVGLISRREAPPDGIQGLPPLPRVTTGHRTELYTETELDESLRKMKASKKAVHNPVVALKACCSESRHLTLALSNLGRVCGMSASLWCVRCISPIRKGGPLVVSDVKWLRPVSQASDMSAVQDSLWLARCKPFLESFTGYSQYGGKFDCIALIIALVVHVQIRQYQGLLSYILFADLKWAFDVANKDLML